jgi:hypothetical protein
VSLPPTVDENAVRALAELEDCVAKREAEVSTLLDNLGLLSGAAARVAADRLNVLTEELEETRAARDAAATAAARAAHSRLPKRALETRDVVTAAVRDALATMRKADPNPDSIDVLAVYLPNGPAYLEVPRSWKAKQAALAALGVTVTVAQQESDLPRWVAEMRLPDGTAVRGSWPESVTTDSTYLFPTSRC